MFYQTYFKSDHLSETPSEQDHQNIIFGSIPDPEEERNCMLVSLLHKDQPIKLHFLELQNDGSVFEKDLSMQASTDDFDQEVDFIVGEHYQDILKEEGFNIHEFSSNQPEYANFDVTSKTFFLKGRKNLKANIIYFQNRNKLKEKTLYLLWNEFDEVDNYIGPLILSSGPI